MQATNCRGQRLPNGSAHLLGGLAWALDLGGTNGPLVVGLTGLKIVSVQVGRFGCASINGGWCIGAPKV